MRVAATMVAKMVHRQATGPFVTVSGNEGGLNHAENGPKLMHRNLLHLTALCILLSFGTAYSQPAPRTLTEQQIAEIIVRESRDAYHKTGRPCACPDDLARNGSRCGARSAYSRPGGADPYCYISDVPKAKIDAYRSRTQ